MLAQYIKARLREPGGQLAIEKSDFRRLVVDVCRVDEQHKRCFRCYSRDYWVWHTRNLATVSMHDTGLQRSLPGLRDEGVLSSCKLAALLSRMAH